jgi:hypothetical protein
MSETVTKGSGASLAVEAGAYLPTIDADGLMWIALQNCVSAPIWGRSTDSFAVCIRILASIVQNSPEWTDAEYEKDIQADTSAIGFFGSIWALLHRKHFFDRQQRVDLLG